MFSSIPALRGELGDRLDAVLPPTWNIVEQLDAKDETLVPAVYLEFVGLNGTMDGQQLPGGVLSAEVNIVITDPKTSADGESSVEEHLVELLAALDPLTDITWTTCRKQKVERTGVWSWVLTVFAFVATSTPAAAPAIQED